MIGDSQPMTHVNGPETVEEDDEEADEAPTAIVADPSTAQPAPVSVEAPPTCSLGASQGSDTSPLDVEPT
jgi:hypothetical protein